MMTVERLKSGHMIDYDPQIQQGRDEELVPGECQEEF